MIGRPRADEYGAYYATYVNQAPGEDPLARLEAQVAKAEELFAQVSEERSRYRYAAGKWSMREVLGHANDVERLMSYRALWFGRGLAGALASFDQNVAITAAGADEIAWREHAEEFRRVRAATLALFRHMPAAGWSRCGEASGMAFSVRALAFVIAGHFEHHRRILRESYLTATQ